MAATFKNFTVVSVPLAGSTVYTTPASTQTIVIGFQIANKSTTSNVAVEVTAAGAQIVGTDTPIPIGSALVPFEGKIVLEATDTITVVPDVDAVLDVVMSVLELT